MTATANIVVDTYAPGGPQPILEAAARLSVQGGPHIALVGEISAMRLALDQLGYDPMYLRLVDSGVAYPHETGDSLAGDRAARNALPAAFKLLGNGDADAMVTASRAPLVLDLGTEHLGTIAEGLPVAQAAVFPTMPRRSSDDPLALLVDVSGRNAGGAHALCAFALLGAAYTRVVSGVREPHVALLSTELSAQSGPEIVVDAHAGLKTAPGMHFVGNIRATDLPRGLADVVVADGFAGHAVHGLLDALTELTVDAARYAWKTKVSWRVAMRLLKKGVGMLKRVSEFKEYGGAPVLGLKRTVILAAPGSPSLALANAVKLAAKCSRRGLDDEVRRVIGMTDAWQPPESP